jgi:hypothetical protein
MGRKAEFSINGLSVLAELKKVDRKKIYGWSTIEVFDQNGSKCKRLDFTLNFVTRLFTILFKQRHGLSCKMC